MNIEKCWLSNFVILLLLANSLLAASLHEKSVDYKTPIQQLQLKAEIFKDSNWPNLLYSQNHYQIKRDKEEGKEEEEEQFLTSYEVNIQDLLKRKLMDRLKSLYVVTTRSRCVYFIF